MMTKRLLLLTLVPPQFAGYYYIVVEKGFRSERVLNVSINEFDGELSVRDVLADGKICVWN